MSEPLTPERSVRLLRAKAAELEAEVLNGRLSPFSHLAADIALVATLLAEHIELSQAQFEIAHAHQENLIERVYALEGGDE